MIKSLPLFISLHIIAINSRCSICYIRIHGNVILILKDACICFTPKLSVIKPKIHAVYFDINQEKEQNNFGILIFSFHKHRPIKNIASHFLPFI